MFWTRTGSSSTATNQPRLPHADCRDLQAPRTQGKNGIQGDASGTEAPGVTNNASSSSATRGVDKPRQLGGLQVAPIKFVPSKADRCRRCASCKKQPPGNALRTSMGLKCKLACKHCPDTVVLGTGHTLSFEVDGITTTQFVREPASGGQGRGLQGELNTGDSVIQRATTIFEGLLRQHTCICVGFAIINVPTHKPEHTLPPLPTPSGPVAFAGGVIPPVNSIILPVRLHSMLGVNRREVPSLSAYLVAAANGPRPHTTRTPGLSGGGRCHHGPRWPGDHGERRQHHGRHDNQRSSDCDWRVWCLAGGGGGISRFPKTPVPHQRPHNACAPQTYMQVPQASSHPWLSVALCSLVRFWA